MILAISGVVGSLLVQLGIGAGIALIGKLMGNDKDEELDREIAANNKQVKREMAAYVQNREKVETSKAREAGRAQMALDASSAPVLSRDIEMSPFVGGMAPPSDMTQPTAPPTAAPAVGMGSPEEVIASLQASPELAAKLVGSVLARGEKPTVFDYAGLMV